MNCFSFSGYAASRVNLVWPLPVKTLGKQNKPWWSATSPLQNVICQLAFYPLQSACRATSPFGAKRSYPRQNEYRGISNRAINPTTGVVLHLARSVCWCDGLADAASGLASRQWGVWRCGLHWLWPGHRSKRKRCTPSVSIFICRFNTSATASGLTRLGKRLTNWLFDQDCLVSISLCSRNKLMTYNLD